MYKGHRKQSKTCALDTAEWSQVKVLLKAFKWIKQQAVHEQAVIMQRLTYHRNQTLHP